MNPNKIRKGYAPYSTTGEQVGQTPLEGYVDVAQAIYPAVNTGQIGEDGEWSGVVVSDKTFTIDTTHEGTPNGAAVLVPQKQPDFVDMTGYNSIFVAIRPSVNGAIAIRSVMGPDTSTFANLTPVNAGSILRGNVASTNDESMDNILLDGAETLVANVWNIFYVKDRLANQKLLQFQITNDAGSNSDITFAYMRMV